MRPGAVHNGRLQSALSRTAIVLGGLAACVIGGTPAGAAKTAPQSLAPGDAPVEWVHYAEAAATTIASWIAEDGETALRFRHYLDQNRATPDALPPVLNLKIWFDKRGKVTKLDFVPFALEQANTDLRAVIIGRPLASAPPKNILLPLRLSVSQSFDAAKGGI